MTRRHSPLGDAPCAGDRLRAAGRQRAGRQRHRERRDRDHRAGRRPGVRLRVGRRQAARRRSGGPPERGARTRPLHAVRGHRDRVPDRARVRIPESVAPQNEAEAVNDQCTECSSWPRRGSSSASFPRRSEPHRRGPGDPGRRARGTSRRSRPATCPVDQLHQAVEEQEARVRDGAEHELVLPSDPDSEADVLDRWGPPGTDLDDRVTP